MTEEKTGIQQHHKTLRQLAAERVAAAQNQAAVVWQGEAGELSNEVTIPTPDHYLNLTSAPSTLRRAAALADPALLLASQSGRYGTRSTSRQALALEDLSLVSSSSSEHDSGSDDNTSLAEVDCNEETDSEPSDHSHDGSKEEEGSSFDDQDIKPHQSHHPSLQNQLKALKGQESHLMRQVTASNQHDALKGQHVKNQFTLWNHTLDARIRLQRCLVAANTLPSADTLCSPESNLSSLIQGDKDIHQAIQDTAKEMVELMDCMLDIRHGMAKAAIAPSTTTSSVLGQKRLASQVIHSEPSSSSIQKQDIRAIGSLLHHLDTTFKPYRDSTLDKWGAKVSMANGVPLGDRKFKALNQSITSQIRAVLQDQGRLWKRTRLNRNSIVPLGWTPTELEDTSPKNLSISSIPDSLDGIFDDGDFYGMLLKEFVESKMEDVDDPLVMAMKDAHLNTLRAQQKKMRKRVVDTKASKGRRIRYTVAEKLVRFMAPEPRGDWHEEKVDELFRSLLQ